MDELEREVPSPERPEEVSPRDIAESPPGDSSTPTPNGDAERSAEAGNESLDAGSEVMGRLPRTRPQRRSGRRPATTVETGEATKTGEAKAKRSPSAAARPRSSTGSRGRAPSSAARAQPAAGGRKPGETATRAAARKRAPGVPQLAVDVAIGAAKIPLKVTASVTRRATHLIGRGLRLR